MDLDQSSLPSVSNSLAKWKQLAADNAANQYAFPCRRNGSDSSKSSLTYSDDNEEPPKLKKIPPATPKKPLHLSAAISSLSVAPTIPSACHEVDLHTKHLLPSIAFDGSLPPSDSDTSSRRSRSRSPVPPRPRGQKSPVPPSPRNTVADDNLSIPVRALSEPIITRTTTPQPRPDPPPSRGSVILVEEEPSVAPGLPPRPSIGVMTSNSQMETTSTTSHSEIRQSVSMIPAANPQICEPNGVLPMPDTQMQSISQTQSTSSLTETDRESSIGSTHQDIPLPTSTNINRKPPVFEGALKELSIEARCMDIHDTLACISTANTLHLYDLVTGNQIWSYGLGNDIKPSCLGILADFQQVWLGTKDGAIHSFDLNDPHNTKTRRNIHMQALVHIGVHNGIVWSLSEDGKVCLWNNGDVSETPKPFRVTPNFKAFCIMPDGTLWVGKNKQMFVYQPSLSTENTFLLTPRPLSYAKNRTSSSISEFSYGCSVPGMPDYAFFGHEDGKVTVFSRSQLTIIYTSNISLHRICSMCGIGKSLWIALKSGSIILCDVSEAPWKIIKEWKAHEGAINSLHMSDTIGSNWCPIASVGTKVVFWDGFLKNDTIENDLQQRIYEYCSFNDLLVKIVTWNVGASRPSDLNRNIDDRNFIRNALTDGLNDKTPDIIVFGFQELVELDNRTVTAKTMFLNKKKDVEKKVSTSSHISHQYKDWQDYLNSAVAANFDENYQMIQSSNMVGLFTCVFMKSSISSSRLRGTRSSEIKTGLGGLHGNKGGLAVRLIVDDSSICFVNCHLAAGQTNFFQRDKDAETILETKFLDVSQNTKYTGTGIFANGGDGTMIMDHESVFFSGDMNYRINLMRPQVMKELIGNNLIELLENDQLKIQLNKNPDFRLRQFQEAPIRFEPTYKFDVGTDNYDTSEKKRVPAWCDRIFYRGFVSWLSYDDAICRVSDHRPVTGLYQVQTKIIDNEKRERIYEECLDRWGKGHGM